MCILESAWGPTDEVRLAVRSQLQVDSDRKSACDLQPYAKRDHGSQTWFDSRQDTITSRLDPSWNKGYCCNGSPSCPHTSGYAWVWVDRIAKLEGEV